MIDNFSLTPNNNHMLAKVNACAVIHLDEAIIDVEGDLTKVVLFPSFHYCRIYRSI